MDLEAVLKLMEIEIVAMVKIDTRTEVEIRKRTQTLYFPLLFSLNTTCEEVLSKIYPTTQASFNAVSSHIPLLTHDFSVGRINPLRKPKEQDSSLSKLGFFLPLEWLGGF